MHYDAHEISRKFAEAFKYHRERLGISREELSRECGFSISIQGKWERGDCCPGLYCLVTIADFMGITVDELVGREKHRTQ